MIDSDKRANLLVPIYAVKSVIALAPCAQIDWGKKTYLLITCHVIRVIIIFFNRKNRLDRFNLEKLFSAKSIV
jgi:hypothetical protein